MICLVLLVAMFMKHFIAAAALLAVPGILFLLVGAPVRVLMTVFAIQIVFTVTQLSAVTFPLGFIPLRVDDMLTILFLWLWVLSIPDGSMKGLRPGLQGYLIIAYLLVFAYSFQMGRAAGNEMLNIGYQVLPYGAYFTYFPLLWILSDPGNRKLLWRTLLVSAVVGGVIYTVKGYMKSGEKVYIRETTGVRIATRQPNAIAAVMLLYMGLLWKDWKNRPALILVVPSLILMGMAIILSQTRGIWGGFVLAMASAWILNLFRRKDNVRLGRKLVVSITVTAVLLIILVFAISTMGILSAQDIAQRTSETSSFATSKATLARLLAWNAILEDLHGRSLLVGRGLGATYTSFRPDIGSVMTVHYVDSSYFQLLLNMGLIGVVAFTSIFIVALFRAARLFVRTEDPRRAGMALGVFCAVIMLLFASGFASVLTNYRFSMLWAFLLALLQVEILLERRGRSIPAGT